MFLSLPEPLAAYFAADSPSADCFAEDALVHDEGDTHRGRAAIREWRESTARKYSFTTEPLSVNQEGEKWLVRSRVSGNFPGSPVELQYSFRLSDDQIAELNIS